MEEEDSFWLPMHASYDVNIIDKKEEERNAIIRSQREAKKTT